MLHSQKARNIKRNNTVTNLIKALKMVHIKKKKLKKKVFCIYVFPLFPKAMNIKHLE